MTLRLIEPAVDALLSRLQSDLPAAVTTVNGEHSDGYTIEAPAQVYDFVPPESMLTDFPTVGITHVDGRFEDDIGSSATGVYRLAVYTFVQDSDQEALAKKIRRTTLAVARVVLASRNFGTGSGVPWGVTVDRIDYGPALADTDKPESYMSFSVLTVQVKLDED